MRVNGQTIDLSLLSGQLHRGSFKRGLRLEILTSSSPLTLKQKVAMAAWGGESGVEVLLTNEGSLAKKFIVDNLLIWGSKLFTKKATPLYGFNIGSSGRFSRGEPPFFRERGPL